MKRKGLGLTALIFFCFGIVTLQFMAVPGKAVAGEIQLGALIPLTGFASGFGQNQKVALDLAVEEINKAGGIKGNTLSVITYDTESKGEKAIFGFRKLATQDKVLAVLGPFLSTEAEVCFPLANKYSIVSISASAAKPGLAAKHRPYGFTNSTSDLNTLPPAVDYWEKKHNIKKVCIVTDIKDALNKSTGKIVFPKLFGAKGIEVIGTSDFVTGEMDFSAHVSKFKGMNPDGVAVSCTVADAAGFIKEAIKQGLEKPFIGGVAIQTPKFLELAGKDANGTVTSASFWVENPVPKSMAFVEEFKKRYGGKAPNPFAANMHENVYIMKHLIETMGVTNKSGDLTSDREKIQKGLASLKNFDGVTGTFSMLDTGTVDKSGYVLMAMDGEWVRP
jgi:branched-chain amino acid transport system substrate-binding protein